MEAFEFLDVADRSEKPREKGLTSLMPLSHVPQHILDGYGQYIDIVKIIDTALWMDAEVLKRDIARYKEHDIEVQIGGVPYELARLQGQEERFLNRAEELGIDWLEYQTFVEDPDVDEIDRKISDLNDRGFNVLGEVGSIWYWHDDTRMDAKTIDVDSTIEEFQMFLDAGCDKVYWEGVIVKNLIGPNLDNRAGQKALLDVVSSVRREDVVFELWGPELTGREHARFWAWLVHQFGPEVNLANVPLGQLPRLEGVRRGTMYDMDHPYVRWLRAGHTTEDWWAVKAPPYDEGL